MKELVKKVNWTKKKKIDTQYSGHLSAGFDRNLRQRTVDYISNILSQPNWSADFIAVRGLSGVIIGTYVADKLGLPLAVVRKPGEDHHGYGIEGVDSYNKNYSYIIIDDLISTGHTINSIHNILEQQSNKLYCNGLVLYYTYTQNERPIDDTTPFPKCSKLNSFDWLPKAHIFHARYLK